LHSSSVKEQVLISLLIRKFYKCNKGQIGDEELIFRFTRYIYRVEPCSSILGTLCEYSTGGRVHPCIIQAALCNQLFKCSAWPKSICTVWQIHYTKSPPRMQCWGVHNKKYITPVLKKASRFCRLFQPEGPYIFTSKTCSIYPTVGHPVGCSISGSVILS
jgi:hypothetical protein